MPETARELLRPLTAEQMEQARQQKQARDQGLEPGLRLWPDIRPEHEKNQTDITQITRDIARGS